jgi:hypothetical protein
MIGHGVMMTGSTDILRRLLWRKQLRRHHRNGKISALGFAAKLLWVMMAFVNELSESTLLMTQFTD